MLISLLRSKKVCSFDVSWCVPVLEPLRFVDVIVILLFVCGFSEVYLFGFFFFKYFQWSHNSMSVLLWV